MCSVERLEDKHDTNGDDSANSSDDGVELMEGEASRNIILSIWRLLVICGWWCEWLSLTYAKIVLGASMVG